ncbi:hypothetical protein ABZV93_08860 [Actinopolymorpha sp. NPDC004070]|uniref:hypothetical protein n=1 Tax=Actinopolymorpha sp. NPDC004070 TaxID=3154548 RepID=UPI0033A7F67E
MHTLDHECRTNVPYWTGVDLEDHVMRAADGQVKLIDLFVAGGGACREAGAT